MASPDTLLLNASFEQKGPGAILVTPTGGTQTSLANQLGSPTFTTATTTTLVATTATLTTAAVTSLAVSGYEANSIAAGLTAVGTDRATALVLAKQNNFIATAAAGTGVLLPLASTLTVGTVITNYNSGASLIKVYANGSETIDGTAGATGVDLTNAKRCAYTLTSATAWISAQLGAVSA